MANQKCLKAKYTQAADQKPFKSLDFDQGARSFCHIQPCLEEASDRSLSHVLQVLNAIWYTFKKLPSNAWWLKMHVCDGAETSADVWILCESCNMNDDLALETSFYQLERTEQKAKRNLGDHCCLIDTTEQNICNRTKPTVPNLLARKGIHD